MVTVDSIVEERKVVSKGGCRACENEVSCEARGDVVCGGVALLSICSESRVDYSIVQTEVVEEVLLGGGTIVETEDSKEDSEFVQIGAHGYRNLSELAGRDAGSDIRHVCAVNDWREEKEVRFNIVLDVGSWNFAQTIDVGATEVSKDCVVVGRAVPWKSSLLRLHDGGPEWEWAWWLGEDLLDRLATSALPENHHLCRITAEAGDVVRDPVQAIV